MTRVVPSACLCLGILVSSGCAVPFRLGIGPTVATGGALGFQVQAGFSLEMGAVPAAVGVYENLGILPHRGDQPTSGNIDVGLGTYFLRPDLALAVEAGLGYAADLPSQPGQPGAGLSGGASVPGLGLHVYALRSFYAKHRTFGGSILRWQRGLTVLLGGGLKYQHYFPEGASYGLFFLPLVCELRGQMF